jgi:hypothetical protein
LTRSVPEAPIPIGDSIFDRLIADHQETPAIHVAGGGRGGGGSQDLIDQFGWHRFGFSRRMERVEQMRSIRSVFMALPRLKVPRPIQRKKRCKSCAGYLWPDAPDRVQEAFRKNEQQEPREPVPASGYYRIKPANGVSYSGCRRSSAFFVSASGLPYTTNFTGFQFLPISSPYFPTTSFICA